MKNPSLAFVVAHFHPQGRVASHLLNLVKHMAELTPRVVVASSGISAAEAERLAPYAQVLSRENFGYDFWSYKLGIEALGDRSELSRLVLCNSSFITLDPEHLCRTFLTRIEEPALRGITVSNEYRWHAQSYWVAFEHGTLINSSHFDRWWDDMIPISERNEVIRRHEIGMSTHFASVGVPITGAFVPTLDELLIAACRAIEVRFWRYENLARSVTLDLETAKVLNPTMFLWDSLLTQFQFVKLELLVRNPFHLNLTPLWAHLHSSEALRTLVKDATA